MYMQKKTIIWIMAGVLSLITVLFILYLNTRPQYAILLTGASLAKSDNQWFEMGCYKLNAIPINRSVGNESIADAANKMITGNLYSKKELENIDALTIFHVWDENVCDETQLCENYKDYKTPFDRYDYAAAYDYVIKRYLSDCYELRNDSTSKYYLSQAGKPAAIILCTYWHDARTTYNNSIRRLAEKWGFPLIEFDKYIGFSKNQPHPVTKESISLLYSYDSEEINNVTYGHHPYKGKREYMQQHISAIFCDKMKKNLPIKEKYPYQFKIKSMVYQFYEKLYNKE